MIAILSLPVVVSLLAVYFALHMAKRFKTPKWIENLICLLLPCIIVMFFFSYLIWKAKTAPVAPIQYAVAQAIA